MSFLGGYPVGGRIIKELYDQGKIQKDRAETMLLYCVNSGPAFILVAVGSGVLHHRKAGVYILIANIIASVTLAVFAERKNTPPEPVRTRCTANIGDAFVVSVSDAVYAMFSICGWVVLFSAFWEIVKLLTPPYISNTLSFCFEVSSGIQNADRNVPLIAAIIGFGGFCVHCQVFSSAKGFTPKYAIFVAYRVVHSLVSALLTYIFLRIDNEAVQTITNGVEFTGHNKSFTYASAISLLFTSIVFIASTYNAEKNVEKGRYL